MHISSENIALKFLSW